MMTYIVWYDDVHVECGMIHDVEWGMAPYILWYDCVSIVMSDRLKVISGDFICNNLVCVMYQIFK